ncbi:hypothetical protein GQX73_g4039 [Xylaria multiplex]|uniref:Uncharacterized protein n=1 Tax=Xylaria multiplex TaxID=323545 RepID=A0A7C8N6E7_9PEZI|nr:hypothetical protein GQX73_g4039 [Xylaria multiplex]
MSSERIPRITIHEAEPRQPRPKQRKPATTFDEIIGLAPLDEPDRDRRPSSLSRAATALRKRIIGRTQEEKDAKLEKNRTKELTNLFSELTLERAAERRTTRLRNLREKAIGGNSLGWYSLEELAESELVYINPRRTRQRGFQGDERALADGLVARLSGLLQDSYYIFLGYDKNLYISTYKTGRAATVIPLKTERQQYSEYRELSRAYYQLCAKLDLDE